MKLLLTSGGVTNPEHPLGARTASRQAGLRVPRPLCPDRTMGSPKLRSGIGAGIRRRRARMAAFLRPRLGVARSPRDHRTADHRLATMVPWGRAADVLLVDGGDATYLCHWMRESGLADCCLRCPTRSGWE